MTANNFSKKSSLVQATERLSERLVALKKKTVQQKQHTEESRGIFATLFGWLSG
jgi:hypothetical protein